ncbi:MAG: biotin--[acetyl-CoA-carboxylase] ligase [Flavobacteriaceae bacterium]|nr:biotin--[acetyl-CoA-carboxylase] ligase [Flavobacteriaceae bacterium]
MKLFKLDAINSTNTYLRQLSKKKKTDNWTVISAEYQTIGRGQVDTKWVSDKGKNLIFSVLINYDTLIIQDQFYLNSAISLGIYNALLKYNLPKLKIKWPNDIMAENKKMGGILIENSLKNDKIYQSVVGIGLNVNQEDFLGYSFQTISMKNILNLDIDRNNLLNEIIFSIKHYIDLLNKHEFSFLHAAYESVLFRINKPHMFESNGQVFLGKITGVTKDGKIKIEDKNKQIHYFYFKEVKYL